uniref:Retrotransposon gag domain-containing protein n=1 Tax=Phytophthora ramorum TaxID=164328 RepID=H3H289_PHYRM
MTEVAAAQLLATVQRPFPQNQEKHVKRDNGAEDAAAAQSVQATQGATTRTFVSRAQSASRTQGTSRAQGASSAEQTPHSGSRRSDDKRKPPKKEKRQDASPPADPDPSGDSSSEDSSSGESDYDFGQNADSNLTAAKTPEGTTLLTFRPYINSHTLSEFDTKAAIRERVHWWEQFANLAAQGAWSNKMRIQELKLKLSGAARDWFNQLPKHTQRDWKELATAFRKKYCKARASYSERYYTMEMRSSESALDFFYRLNSAAGKADIDFRKSTKRLEKHIRRFITKLKETRLKTSLQGQRFKSISDLEYALEQDEEVWTQNERDAATSRNRDFRAGNLPNPGRPRPKRFERAYLTQNADFGVKMSEYPEELPRMQDAVEESGVSAQGVDSGSQDNRDDGGALNAGPSGAEWTQTLTNEVYRVMDNMGWRPPGHAPHGNPVPNSGRRENPNWDKYCEKCHKWGHPEESCWKDIKCDRCQELGHPTHMCRAQPCDNCGKLHQGKPCEDWKALEDLKKLARQGALKDLPSHILDKLLDGEASTGKPLNL